MQQARTQECCTRLCCCNARITPRAQGVQLEWRYGSARFAGLLLELLALSQAATLGLAALVSLYPPSFG